MKNVLLQLLVLAVCLVLVGCGGKGADSSTSGTCITKEYDIDMPVRGNDGITFVNVSVNVAADSVHEVQQDTAGKSNATLQTDFQVPIQIPMR